MRTFTHAIPCGGLPMVIFCCIAYLCLSPVISIQLQFDHYQLVDVLEERPITVDPPDSSCSKQDGTTTILSYYRSPQDYDYSGDFPGEPEAIRCTSDCPKIHPQTYRTQELIGADPQPFGSPSCRIPDSLTVPVQPPPSRFKRAANTDCVTSVPRSYSIDEQGETYTLWVKPDHEHVYGTILSSNVFTNLELRFSFNVDLANNTIWLRVITGSNNEFPIEDITYPAAYIPYGAWTGIGVQVVPERYTYSIAVSVNGSLLQPPYTMYTSPQRRKRQTNEFVPTGPESIFLGISGEPYFNFNNEQCQLSSLEQCRNVGYSAYVAPFHNILFNNLNDHEKAIQDILERVDVSCPDILPEESYLYVCSSILPPCTAGGNLLRPCRSLCENFVARCSVNASALDTQCQNLPDGDCIDFDYIPEYGMFRGHIKEATYHQGLLSQREIQEVLEGKLPTVNPRTDCLCPYPSVGMATSLYCNVASQFLEHPTRLDHSNKVPEAINDKPYPMYYHTQETDWFSADGVDPVRITIDFGGHFLIYNLSMETSGYSGLFSKKTTFQLLNDGEWRDIGYMATNCSSIVDQTGKITPMQFVGCESVERSSTDERSTFIGEFRSGVEANQGVYDVHPLVLDLFSGTALRVTMEGFVNDRNKFRNIAHLAMKGWKIADDICECFDGGLAPNLNDERCDEENRCMCRPNAGDPATSKYTCYPYILRNGFGVLPNYGPESGGTEIFISGGFFGLGNMSASVEFGQLSSIFFQIEAMNETVIKCITPNITGRVQLRQPKNIFLRLYIGTPYEQNMVLKDTFEFREDPVIESIQPRSTFLRGGINQTVVGQYIDSVFAPYMDVTIVYTKGASGRQEFPQQPTLCRVTNSTEMVCPTPDILHLPPEYRHLLTNGDDAQRRKRHTDVHDHRQKRQNQPTLNNGDFQFYLGFKLDGVTTYDNVSEVLPQQGVLDVYTNPDLYPWAENELKAFQVYKGDVFIRIDGERLTFGCTKKDYLIEIGQGLCEVVDLFINTLQCRPPTTRPELGSIHSAGSPAVTARVGNIYEFIGYLHYQETAWDNPAIKSAVIAVIVVVVVVIIVVVVVIVFLKRRRQSMQRTEAEKNKYFTPPTLWSTLPDEMKAELEPCIVSSNSLKLGNKVGEGNFGTVYVGRYTDEKKGPILVAAKTVKDKSVKPSELVEFLEEATLMKDFRHENVLNLTGVVINDGLPFVLLPLMENGDLRTYIINPKNIFTVRDLLDFGVQVAKGMQYLSGLKFVHRDLAARNCMVSRDNIIKVADFGLARDIYSNEYYRTENKSRPLPVKWMAPESLDDSKFTTKSDVWSYGVLVWELLTRGKKPYAHVDNFQIRHYLKTGQRLEKPTVSPDEVYELMQQCWNMNPSTRPEFGQIAHELEVIIHEDDDTSPPEAGHEKPAEHAASGGASEYENLSRYVDHTTDRHGYEQLHEDQTADMPVQIDYIQAAKDLNVDLNDDDGYLVVLESNHQVQYKPSPKPRTSKPHSSDTPRYQNIGAIQEQLATEEKQNSSTVKPDNIELVEVSAPDNEDFDIPLYQNTKSIQGQI